MNHLNNINDIIQRLSELDEECEQAGIRGRMVMMGGAALKVYLEMKAKKRFRPTIDIDVSIVLCTNEQRLHELMEKTGIQELGGIISLPPYEDFTDEKNWFELDGEFTNIQVFIPKIELLICSKIFSTRGKDLDDLLYTDIIQECDIMRLKKMIKEYRDNCIELVNPALNYHHLHDIFEKNRIEWE